MAEIGETTTAPPVRGETTRGDAPGNEPALLDRVADSWWIAAQLRQAILGGRYMHGEMHHFRLDAEAYFDQLQRTRELRDALAVAGPAKIHERTRAETTGHEPLCLEPVQRGADGRARCAEGRSKIGRAHV